MNFHQTPTIQRANESNEWLLITLNKGILAPNESDSWDIFKEEESGEMHVETLRWIYKFKFRIAQVWNFFEVFVWSQEEKIWLSFWKSKQEAIEKTLGRIWNSVREVYEPTIASNRNAQKHQTSNTLDFIKNSLHEKKYDKNIEWCEPDLKFWNFEYQQTSRCTWNIHVILHGKKILLWRYVYSVKASKNWKRVVGHKYVFTSEVTWNMFAINSNNDRAAEEIVWKIYNKLTELSPKEFPPEVEKEEIDNGITYQEWSVDWIDYTLYIDKNDAICELLFTYEELYFKINMGLSNFKNKWKVFVLGNTKNTAKDNKIQGRLSWASHDQNKALKVCVTKILHTLKSKSPGSIIYRDCLSSYMDAK